MYGIPVGIDLTKIGSSQGNQVPQHELGDLLWGRLTDGSYGFFEYARAEGAVTAGSLAYIDGVNDARALDTTGSGSTPRNVGAAVATLADEECGWFWRGGGRFEVFVANGTTTGAVLTTTATAGEAGAGGDAIIGLTNLDEGVTTTRVTCYAVTLMATNT